MRALITAALLCVSWASAQTGPSDPLSAPAPTGPAPAVRPPRAGVAAPGTPAAQSTSLPPDAPVVTMQGICKAKSPQGACKTVVTRAELDDFTRAFAPQAPESARGRMAVQYARSLAYATLAEQQGIAGDPELSKELERQLKLVRMRILATAYLQSVQKKLGAITGAEIQAYYDTHRELFEEAQVRRVAVPFAVPTADGRPLDHSAVRVEMEKIRGLAAAGQDLNELQQQAYKDLHIQTAAPPVVLLAVRRSNLQGDEAKVLDLKEGELSPLLDLPGAFAFSQLISKQPVAAQSVRPEIEAGLRRERMQKALGTLNTRITAQFNLEFLDLATQPDLFGDTATTPKPARASSARRKPVRRTPLEVK